MSDQEDEEWPAVVEEAPVHDYIELKTKEEVEALEPMQACAYIEKLHEIIRKYDKKIAVYKQKLMPFVRCSKQYKFPLLIPPYSHCR